MAPERKGPAETDGPYDEATGPQAAPLPETHDPHENEGFLHPLEVARRAAIALLPKRKITVERRFPRKPPEETSYGTIYAETAYYSDGAKRNLTIFEPREARFDGVGLDGDAWYMGENGIPDRFGRYCMALGLLVVSNHHEGNNRFSLPKNLEDMRNMVVFSGPKSLSRYAAHDHALLDDLSPHLSVNTDRIFRRGYSRAAMIGEAFVALTAMPHSQEEADGPTSRQPSREVVWTDMEAACFAQGVSFTQFMALIVGKHFRHELDAIKDIRHELAELNKLKNPKAIDLKLKDYLGSFNLEIHDIAHELAWAGLLIKGDAGVFGRVIPDHTKGLRTVYKKDASSQQHVWREIHRGRPGITFLEEEGGHLAALKPSMVEKKINRIGEVIKYAEEHEGNLDGITAEDVLPKPPKKHRPKPKK